MAIGIPEHIPISMRLAALKRLGEARQRGCRLEVEDTKHVRQVDINFLLSDGEACQPVVCVTPQSPDL